MPRNSLVAHRLKIERWKFDYSFGVADPKFDTGAYSDGRTIILEVAIERPTIRPKRGRVLMFAINELIGAQQMPVRKFGDRLAGKPDTVKPVGRLWYRGDEYTASLFFPADMLGPLLTMLSADRYRYLNIDAEEGGREAGISSFYFSGNDDGPG